MYEIAEPVRAGVRRRYGDIELSRKDRECVLKYLNSQCYMPIIFASEPLLDSSE